MANVSKSTHIFLKSRKQCDKEKTHPDQISFLNFYLMVSMSCVLDNVYANTTHSQAFKYFRILKQSSLFLLQSTLPLMLTVKILKSCPLF